MTVLVDLDPRSTDTILRAVGSNARVLTSLEALDQYLVESPGEYVVVLAPSVGISAAFELSERMRVERPALGVIMVQELVDATLLNEALRSGVREVVSRHDLPALSAAVERATEVANRMREREYEHEQELEIASGDREPGTVITVFSAKGGCGKTTLATNLATALADRGDTEVCVLDLDLAFGDVAIAMQLYPGHTIADAMEIPGTLDEFVIRGLLTMHSPGVNILAAPLEPGSAQNIPATLVTDLIQHLRLMFDAVIIDTPAAFSDQVLAAFDLTDLFLLIATLDIPALKNLKLTLETMDLLNYPRERWRVVLNRADSKVGLTVSEVEKALRLPISAQIPSSRAVPTAINRGVPIVRDDPGHPVSVEIRRLAGRIAALNPQGPLPNAAERRGLLRRRARNS